MAHISVANKVLPMLAPKIVMKAAPINAHSSMYLGTNVEIKKVPMHLDVPQVHTHPTQERLDKLFEKLDLNGAQGWSDKEKQEVERSPSRIP